MVMGKGNRIKNSAGDLTFIIFTYMFLTIAMLMVIYPLIFIVSSSFSDPRAVVGGKVRLIPIGFNIDAYRRVFENGMIITGFKNSFINTIAAVIINITLTLFAAYPLSRPNLAGRHLVSTIFIITMLFSGGLIPLYITVKNYGLIDSRMSLLLPGAMSVYLMIVARSFLQITIPEELREAATIDGCGEFNFFGKVVLPLAKPIISVLSLMYAITQWNSYFYAMVFLKSPELYPLQIVLRNILIQNSIDISLLSDVATAMAIDGMRELIKYALIVVACVPVLIIYPFAQKYFIKGMLLGAIKG